MNDTQKQQAMVKLAQVRLAINHVIRQRAMQKQAAGDPHNPKYYGPNGVRNLKGFWSGVPLNQPAPGETFTPWGRVRAFFGWPKPTNDPRTLNPGRLYFDQPELRRRQLDPTDPSYGK